MRRGFSLFEVLISGALFLLVLLMILTVYATGQKAYKKSEREVDARTSVLRVAEQLKQEVRHARILSTNPALVYQVPQRDPNTGRVQFDPATQTLVFDPSSITVSLAGDGRVLRTRNGFERTLGNFGSQGRLEFASGAPDLLVARLTADVGHGPQEGRGRAFLELHLHLPNQP